MSSDLDSMVIVLQSDVGYPTVCVLEPSVINQHSTMISLHTVFVTVFCLSSSEITRHVFGETDMAG